jgi:hypothetical protein
MVVVPPSGFAMSKDIAAIHHHRRQRQIIGDSWTKALSTLFS